MKINLENMKELASKMDNNKTLDDLNMDDFTVMSMAYQIQYFFEAMNKIKEEAVKSRVGMSYALDLLTSALVDKPDKEMKKPENAKKAFEISEGEYTCVAWWGDGADALIVINRNGKKFKEFYYPSYKVFNIGAHFSDIVEDFERGMAIASSPF